MKQVAVDNLKPDPILNAIANADGETTILAGYVRDRSKKVISIAVDKSGQLYGELNAEDIVAAFEEDNAGKVTFVVKASARVRWVKETRLDDDCQCDGGSDVRIPTRHSVGVIADFLLDKDRMTMFPFPDLRSMQCYQSCDNAYKRRAAETPEEALANALGLVACKMMCHGHVGY